MRNIKLGYIGEIKNYKGTNLDLLKMFDLNSYTEVTKEIDLTQTHERLMIDRYVYLVFSYNNERKIYRILPNVVDDDILKWKEVFIPSRKNYTQQLNAQVHCGFLQFGVNYFTTDGSLTIYVSINAQNTMDKVLAILRYSDCEIDNEFILTEIKKYVEKFKNAANSIEIGKQGFLL